MRKFTDDYRIAALLADGRSISEAIDLLANGTVVYDTYGVYLAECLERGEDFSEIPNKADLINGRYDGIVAVNVDGVTRIIEYCL